jgi:flagellar biosynthesis/type III secretory pathway ATPase
MLSNYEDMAEMVRLCACGSRRDERVDTTVKYFPNLGTFLAQDRNDRSDLASGDAELAQIHWEESE